MNRRGLLISLKPHYAEMLLEGRKTVELRRIRPDIEAGDWVLLYASSPQKALVGAFQVSGVSESTPELLWKQIGSDSGISRDDFHGYFRGVCRGVGIHVGKTIRFHQATPLDRMREMIPGFHPPQSYSYVSPDTVSGDVLCNIVRQCEEVLGRT
jgi:predicted transcriptional regulator